MQAAILKALIVVTSHSQLGDTGKPTGYYLPEVTHAYYPLLEAGYRVDFASPRGGAAPLDKNSYDLKDPVNRKFVESKTLTRLDHTIALQDVNPKEYGAIYFAGGHGTMWDFADDANLKRVAAAIYEQGGVVAAVCHGPAALVNVKLSDGKYLVAGKKVAGFSNDEEEAAGLTKVMPFLLESKLKERGGLYSNAPIFENHVVSDGRLITGQNPASAEAVGRAVVKALKN